MINNNSPLHSTLSDGLPAPVHAGDFVLDCAIEAGLLPSHHFFGVRLDLMLEELHGAMAQYEPSDPRVQGCLRALKCGPLRGGALAAADAREIERFVDRLRSNRPEQGRALAAADAREIERFVDRLPSRHLPLKASLLLRDMVPMAGMIYLSSDHRYGDRRRWIETCRSLDRLEASELSSALKSVMWGEIQGWVSARRAPVLGMLLRFLERVPEEERRGVWQQFFASVIDKTLSAGAQLKLLGTLIDKTPSLPESVQEEARAHCLEKILALSTSLQDDSASRKLLLKALERLPTDETFSQKMASAVSDLVGKGLVNEALAWIAHVASRVEGDGSEPWLKDLALMVINVFKRSDKVEGQPAGEVLLAKLSTPLFARGIPEPALGRILRFAQASGGLHHMASMGEGSKVRQAAQALASDALTNPAELAKLPHVALVVPKRLLAQALRVCNAIGYPVLRRARLTEFHADCKERGPYLVDIAAKLLDGLPLGPWEQSLLDGKGAPDSLPTLSESRPRLDDSEPEKLLGRKTQRDKGGPP